MIAVRIAMGAFLVVLMTGCGGGSTMSTPTTPATPAPVTVSILSSARTLGPAAYVPNPAMVPVGTKLTWSNTDTTTHDMVSDGGVWDPGRTPPLNPSNFPFPPSL